MNPGIALDPARPAGVWGWSKETGGHLHVDGIIARARVHAAAAAENCGQEVGSV